jgi:hypothetical protein
MNVPVNTQKELKWKKLDGTLVPLNELTNQELKEFRKIAGKKIEMYYRNFEFFTDLLEQMDEIIHTKLLEAEALVKELKFTENEI